MTSACRGLQAPRAPCGRWGSRIAPCVFHEGRPHAAAAIPQGPGGPWGSRFTFSRNDDRMLRPS
eukprot:4358926-Pyramimonas_sp.AAC.1